MNESSAAPVRVKGLGVRYGKMAALDAVSLQAPGGSVFALLGRNGAGKSSLIRCLLGQQKPQEGATFLFGQSSWKERTRLMARTGVVPEEPDAPPSMTPAQLNAFCGRLYKRWDSAAVEKRLARLTVPLKTPFGRLSKGQKGAVMLSLALGHSPELLILDDPTLGLDAIARAELYDELIGELADRGTTVFLTSHDLTGIERIASRVAILKDARIAVDEDLESLKSRFRLLRYKNERTEARTSYGDELNDFDALRVRVRGWGVEAVVSNFTDEAFEKFRAREGVVDAEAAAMPLEEIFISIAGEKKGDGE